MKNLPAKYWRRNQQWSSWIGQEGTVVTATYVRIPAEEYKLQAPYSFALVDFGSSLGKKELMGCGHERLKSGDKVKIVWRRVPHDDQKSVIDYRLKLKKI